ncbi:hypothetical protein MmiEs2_12000 [Methanimicrococcus stummii]|uniref:Uncharacterized protein n=1 Tax=Methanimicrococcus stummii TaxID=3028294 RepID=A0AA96ZZ81_9EURY|nr:Sjogren's syndrome/scleroderma autoantigen 1 family protein [Methanimicrococcus sp. Es2]WNY28987.1 hypothetical protein MmiEs2_12000 [Methanimicrococcus sp. Es2]
MSDESVKKIARFLENGGTMLANHCDNCGAPLFRFKGEIICPLCSGVETNETPAPVSNEAAPVFCSPGVPAKKANAPQKYKKESKKQTASGTPLEDLKNYTIEPTVYSVEEEQLRELILLKLTAIAEDMQNENDPRRVFEYLEMIEKGLDLIERLY